MKRVKCVTILIAAILLAGCAANSAIIKQSYTVLDSAAAMHNLYKSIVTDLYKDKLITNAEKTQAIVLSVQFVSFYMTAVDSLSAYNSLTTAANQQQAAAAMRDATATLGRFVGLVKPYIARRLAND